HIHMIGGVVHPQTKAAHRSHARRYRYTWAIMAGITLVALLLAASGFFGTVSWMSLIAAILETTYRLIVAYLIALVIGVVIALIVGWSPFIDFFFPVFDILQNLPSFALFPLFIYFLGYTNQMIILFAVSSIVWPILFAVLTAIKSAHTDLSDAATIFGARGLQRIRYYLAPLSFPAILTGSIVGIAIGWESVIGAEIISNMPGFGAFIKNVDTAGISPTAIAGAFAILVIVFIINRLVWAPLLSESAKRYAE
ncbi:MAG: ABC transporter permease, partial [Candidatus Paceibacteria bacterium]